MIVIVSVIEVRGGAINTKECCAIDTKECLEQDEGEVVAICACEGQLKF